MQSIFQIISSILIILTIVGLVSPNKALWWRTNGERSRKAVLLFYGLPYLAMAGIWGAIAINSPTSPTQIVKQVEVEKIPTQKELKDEKIKSINEIHQHTFFEKQIASQLGVERNSEHFQIISTKAKRGCGDDHTICLETNYRFYATIAKAEGILDIKNETCTLQKLATK
jgi:hypothetical protein